MRRVCNLRRLGSSLHNGRRWWLEWWGFWVATLSALCECFFAVVGPTLLAIPCDRGWRILARCSCIGSRELVDLRLHLLDQLELSVISRRCAHSAGLQVVVAVVCPTMLAVPRNLFVWRPLIAFALAFAFGFGRGRLGECL